MDPPFLPLNVTQIIDDTHQDIKDKETGINERNEIIN